jgi:hypothetical protein
MLITSQKQSKKIISGTHQKGAEKVGKWHILWYN